MSSTPLTVLHSGHRKAMRIGANDSMSTVVQVGFVMYAASTGCAVVKRQSRKVYWCTFNMQKNVKNPPQRDSKLFEYCCYRTNSAVFSRGRSPSASISCSPASRVWRHLPFCFLPTLLLLLVAVVLAVVLRWSLQCGSIYSVYTTLPISHFRRRLVMVTSLQVVSGDLFAFI